MEIYCKNNNAVLYSGPYKLISEFIDNFIPVNVDSNGNVIETFPKLKYDEVFVVYNNNEIATIAKQLLAESDWRVVKSMENDTQLSSSWKNYRAALREIINTETFNGEVIFPSQP